MRITLSTRLVLIVGVTALMLTVNIIISRMIALDQMRDLADIEARIVPRLSLQPQIASAFEQLRQEMQNAVAAQDRAALNATLARKDSLLQLISAGGAALTEQDSAVLRHAVADYYGIAEDVSRRLIQGETGEALGADIEVMHARQTRVSQALERATALGHNELASAFATVREANEQSSRYRIALGLCAMLMVLLLSLWTSRGLLRAVREMSGGFTRFATGSFAEPIRVTTNDELADITRAANAMAQSLAQLNAERDRVDWLKESLAGLSDELRGELDPSDITQRALRFIATRVDAVVGAFHLLDAEGSFELSSDYGLAAGVTPRESFRLGEGLSGRAAAGTEVVVVDNPPADYLAVQSSLGGARPHSIVLIPLGYLGKPTGLIELALLAPCSSSVREFVTASRESLVIALEVAKSRVAMRELLSQTQQQAERLAAQEEELRLNNQELESQQDVLRAANEELEAQRGILSEKNDELERARLGLQDKAEELIRMSTYKSQFLASMSHELRTPLNSMLILSHLLAQNEAGRLTDKQVEYAKTIHSAGQDLLVLINQVLDLAKIEAGRQEVRVETIELSSIVSNARKVFEPLASEKGLRLSIEIAPEAPAAITTDRQRLERILTNLLGNAVKFTDHGHVTLTVQRPGPEVSFQRADLDAKSCIAFVVSDSGIGIDAASLERVFAPFEQVDSSSTRRQQGTGLGLAISRESAKLIGGELQLVSTPGKGSTFTCYLPERIGPGSEAAQAFIPSALHKAEDRDATPSDLHVLVVEDDPVIAEQLADVIRARNLNVMVTHTGQEGLNLARERHPRGIVLDVKLPDMDGWLVMDQLRKDPRTSSIPVHFISAVDTPQRAFALGAIGYLTKPVSRDELVSMIRVLVPANQSSPRLLIVEDNVQEGTSLMALLSNEEIELIHVSNASAALAALEERPIGCMILDLGLPDSDGLALLQTLRSRSHIEWPRVIVHTGRALTKKETRELEAYAEAIILKDGSSAERLLEEVRLFVRHVKDNLATREAPRTTSASPLDVSLKGCTVLLAEDDMRTVYAVSALLRGKGAEVVIAETGREALSLLDSHPEVKAVLMDVMMPEMDGYEAMRQLRTKPQHRNLPVIALTAKAMKGERERCLAAGASDYLTKPVDGDLLLATLARWLSSKKSDSTERAGNAERAG